MNVGMLEGPEAVRMRIAELQARFQPRSINVRPTTELDPTKSAAGVLSFDDVMAKASASVAAAGAGPLLDPSKFPNGRIPDGALKSIGGGDKLTAPAADAFLRMRAEAGAAGVAFSVNDSYRSYDEQVATANKLGLYSQGGLAAKPGTSTHGLGLSVDLELNAKAQSWMHANAGKYGFKNDVKGEPWHWTFKG